MTVAATEGVVVNSLQQVEKGLINSSIRKLREPTYPSDLDGRNTFQNLIEPSIVASSSKSFLAWNDFVILKDGVLTEVLSVSQWSRPCLLDLNGHLGNLGCWTCCCFQSLIRKILCLNLFPFNKLEEFRNDCEIRAKVLLCMIAKLVSARTAHLR